MTSGLEVEKMVIQTFTGATSGDDGSTNDVRR